jgi:hypothetical protein
MHLPGKYWQHDSVKEKIIRREPLVLIYVRKQVHIPDGLVLRRIIRIRKAGNAQVVPVPV